MSSRGSRERRTPNITVLLVLGGLVLAVGLSVAAFRSTSAEKFDGPIPDLSPPSAPADPVAAFIGDSYTQGVGSSDRRTGFAQLAADRMGWLSYIDGETGTGYSSDGQQYEGSEPDSRPYADRLKAVARDVDYLVVSGGRNDIVGDTQATDVLPAARAFIAAAQKRAPDATLVVMAPFWDDGHPPAQILAFRDGLRVIAQDAGAVFVDPLSEHWITNKNAKRYIGDDDLHPNDAGHAYLAKRLTDDLVQAGV